ncbi:globin domain-containing protein [Antrihabitans sp. YC2-6]|uniref:globin domain-containing protein n=1 Tax=Antrihabitans sp. YC2-6 TaxID=2799498 RepID=UPI0018F74B7A|nr:globin domain-containing protein [Antrihabitans sp. YC2-6]MBJ8348722.1 flavoprotein [Antrihabitans sp. YC2-6]
MNPRAIALVRSNFRTVTESPRGTDRLTNAFYGYLFGDNPILRQLFPAGMDAQREKFVSALSYIIDILDDRERVSGFLEQLGRDHRKYGVESSHYSAAGKALHSALKSYTGALFWTSSIDAAWASVIDSVVTSMAAGADADDLPAQWSATVVEHRRVLDDLAVIRLRCDVPVPYEAGQYLPIRIPQRPRMWRYFSPAIPWNSSGELEFHVRRISGGWVSPSMVNETQVGDRWSLGAPLGGLRVDMHGGDDVLMIGTGTGLAPLRAQIMEMAMRGTNPRVHLFVGGRYPCDLYDMFTLWQLGMTNPWLTIVPVSELDTNPWWSPEPPAEMPEGMHQRLCGPIGSIVSSFGSWADRQVQIAGSPTMIRSIRQALILGGTPASRIAHDPV